MHVKPEFIDAFKETTLENARKSVQRSGIARFDVVQQPDDRSRFVLVEVYRSSADPGKHKETAHYAKWRDSVAEMMVEPRSSVKYNNISLMTRVGDKASPCQPPTAPGLFELWLR